MLLFATGSDAPHQSFSGLSCIGQQYLWRDVHMKYMKKLDPVYEVLHISGYFLIEVSDFKLDLFKLTLNTLVSQDAWKKFVNP